MGEKATLRMARQELEDLYLGVPDNSVDLTFKDLASSSSSSLPVAATAHTADADNSEDQEGKRKTMPTPGGLQLARSSTNIFTYRPILEEDQQQDMDGGSGGLLQLSPPTPAPPPAAAAAAADRRVRVQVAYNNGGNHNYRRPGVPHSNICALCNKYIYLFRHRCLVCGRVYCRRCVGAGMGDMTEGRKCIDCLGRRYSHRYIHRAGDTTTCLCSTFFWGYYPNAKAVTAQELIWAEKGPAPRRRRQHPPTSISASYASTNASMSMTINSDSSMAMMNINGQPIAGVPASSASSSFVASYAPNPHAFPL